MHLSMLLDMACDGFGDRTVVGRSHDGLTPVDLRRRARAGAQVLRDRQAPALVYLDVNGPAYPVAMFAAAHAGVPLVPINYRLGGEQLDYLLGQHPGALAIVAPDSAAHVASLGLTTMTTDEWLVTAPETQGSWWGAWLAWLQARSGTPVKPPRMGARAYPPVANAPGTYVLEP